MQGHVVEFSGRCLLGRKCRRHTVKNDKLSLLLTISCRC